MNKGISGKIPEQKYKFVTITIDEYYQLRLATEQLQRLKSGGVVNWEGYSDSISPDDGIDWEIREEEIKKEIYNT